MKILLKLPILLLLLSALPFSAHAQGKDDNDNAAIEKACRNSQLSYLALANSYATKKDTTNVRVYLMKVNPYQLLYEWFNTTAPDTFLSKYPLTADAREEIAKKYLEILNGPKSVSYTTFDKMANEDQQLRFISEHTDDERTLQILSRKMRVSDSTHSAFLCNYVKRNGWPSLENGSMPATLLAIHDHRYHEFYLPYLRKAVIDGQADIGALRLIEHWITSGKSYEELQRILDTSRKISFDVSTMLNDRLPANLLRIQKTIQKYCKQKFKTYLVFETTKPTIAEDWTSKRQHQYKKHIFTRFMAELETACPKKFEGDLWAVHFLPAAHTRLVFHILPDAQ